MVKGVEPSGRCRWLDLDIAAAARPIFRGQIRATGRTHRMTASTTAGSIANRRGGHAAGTTSTWSSSDSSFSCWLSPVLFRRFFRRAFSTPCRPSWLSALHHRTKRFDLGGRRNVWNWQRWRPALTLPQRLLIARLGRGAKSSENI